MLAIEIQNLSKRYSKDYCLSDIHFNVEKSKVFALLGPNGAGKTTLVKLILGLLNRDSGTVRINEIDSKLDISRKNVAFIPEKFNFHNYYTAQGVLEFFAKAKGVESDSLQEEIKKALESLKIEDLAKRKLSKMSKGQIQRVGLATILVGSNDLIILDEPFSGLDPIGIKDLKNIILDLRSQGKTIFINSHILSDMEQICDEFAILNKGKLLHVGEIADLKNQGVTLEDFFYAKVNGVN